MLRSDVFRWFLSLDDVQSIERADFSFAAGWAAGNPARVLLAGMLLSGLAIWYYLSRTGLADRRLRWSLAVLRALALAALVACLADPTITLHSTESSLPVLWFLFDGSDSMAIEDDYPAPVRKALLTAVNGNASATSTTENTAAGLGRMPLIRALLKNSDQNHLAELRDRFRLRGFLADEGGSIRELAPQEERSPEIFRTWESELTTRSETTALGRALEDLSLRSQPGDPAGLVLFSDFDQNAGPSATDAARKLGVPVYCVGVGGTEAIDLAVDLQIPLVLKKAERATAVVTLRVLGNESLDTTLTLTARPHAQAARSADRFFEEGPPIEIGRQTLSVAPGERTLEFAWVPEKTGHFVITARAEPADRERITENNSFDREVDVRDDFLRLLFVEHEPTWEWRFIKEVFHRDPLVGERGFRTFLRSADPRVRQSNELFVPLLAPRRSEFFLHDVIFIGDLPAGALSSRFCEMAREFVSQFGGGLVILSGPRFGPGELLETPLAEMLPVVPDRAARVRDDRPFSPRLTPESAAYDFLQLGSTPEENARGWNNLKSVPWYQPVERLHPLGTALATHPVDTCVDGRTLQPLIAARRFGKGEVIYFAFNETWRLRRGVGEKYYRQLWGQMIHRLALSHALGNQKRFVLRIDRQTAQPDEQLVASIEAYSAEFEPLHLQDLPESKLTIEWLPPEAAGTESGPRALPVSESRPGLFEANFVPLVPGEHRLRAVDPMTNERSEVSFRVASVSIERRSAVRNTLLQNEIAQTTGGRSYDLTSLHELENDFHPEPQTKTMLRVVPLSTTWPVFLLIVGLLLAEWLIRRLADLT